MDVSLTDFHFPKADRVRKLHYQYKNDPDAVFTDDGVHFIGPKGQVEDEDTHMKRLAHNARMRFTRSFSGFGFAQNMFGMLLFKC